MLTGSCAEKSIYLRWTPGRPQSKLVRFSTGWKLSSLQNKTLCAEMHPVASHYSLNPSFRGGWLAKPRWGQVPFGVLRSQLSPPCNTNNKTVAGVLLLFILHGTSPHLTTPPFPANSFTPPCRTNHPKYQQVCRNGAQVNFPAKHNNQTWGGVIIKWTQNHDIILRHVRCSTGTILSQKVTKLNVSIHSG